MSGNDRSVRMLLGAIAVLLGCNLLVQVNQSGGGSRAAYAAGIPDSGAQLQAVVDQLADLNKKIDKMESFLEGGTLTVKVKDPKTDK